MRANKQTCSLFIAATKLSISEQYPKSTNWYLFGSMLQLLAELRKSWITLYTDSTYWSSLKNTRRHSTSCVCAPSSTAATRYVGRWRFPIEQWNGSSMYGIIAQGGRKAILDCGYLKPALSFKWCRLEIGMQTYRWLLHEKEWTIYQVHKLKKIN